MRLALILIGVALVWVLSIAMALQPCDLPGQVKVRGTFGYECVARR